MLLHLFSGDKYQIHEPVLAEFAVHSAHAHKNIFAVWGWVGWALALSNLHERVTDVVEGRCAEIFRAG